MFSTVCFEIILFFTVYFEVLRVRFNGIVPTGDNCRFEYTYGLR